MPDLIPEPRGDQSTADAPEFSRSVADLEPLGGDPPCWAHLFEDDDEAPIGGQEQRA